MKKILSLFVTITLLIVSFTGCQNMADIHIDPFKQPESEPKHTITLPKANTGDVTGDGSIELECTTGEEVSIYLYEEKAAHKFIGIGFVDKTREHLDVPYTLDYDEEAKSFKVCFTMPDADIILYRIIIESLPEAEKTRANYHSYSIYAKITGKIKFVTIDDLIEITPDEIDINELFEPEAGVSEWNTSTYTYYFLVTFKCPVLSIMILPEDEEAYDLFEYSEKSK